MKTAAVLVVALALLLQAAAAQPTSQANLTAASITWQGGDMDHASVLGLKHLGETGGAFTLTAPHLHVRTVVADTYIRGPTAGLAYTPGWTYADSDYDSAVLTGGLGRPGAFAYVSPSDAHSAKFTTACGAATADSETFQVPSQIETPNANPVVDLSRAMEIEPCGPSLGLCGSFTVALWERDVGGQSAQGAVRLESGQLARPGEPDARPALGRAQQLYLKVTDGCFTMAPVAGTTKLFTNDASLGNVTTLTLHAAQGTLDGATLHGKTLKLEGRITTRLQRQDAGLDAFVLHGVARAQLDAREITVATTSTRQVGAPAWTTWLTAATLVLAATLGALSVLPSRRLALWYFDAALSSSVRDRERLALFWAARATHADRSLADAHILRGYLLGLKDDLDGALQSRDEAERILAQRQNSDYDRALNAVEAAWLAHRKGDAAGRRNWLALAFEASPSRAALMLLEPDKAPLRTWGMEFACRTVAGYA
jgi:hypothetical protein